MLKLRRGTVLATEPLTVEIEGERRRAWADPGLIGEVREGDEVVVNTEALDLGLGSGGLDLVHVNLSRGLAGPGAGGPHVMKLNYTSLQHPVEPVEGAEPSGIRVPALVIPMHGHLAPALWAAARAEPEMRIGYVQTAGGALPGRLSRDVAELRERGLLAGHVTAGPAHGGEREAISTVGALDAVPALGWDAAIAGPGPGMLGSATAYGHGGMVALDSCHAALALGLPTLLSPRLSEADPRPRHRALSHHTAAVLELLLAPVRVPVPAGHAEALSELRGAAGERHSLVECEAPLESYAESGLPRRTMGRDLDEDPLYFAAPLAAGTALAGASRG